MNASNRFRTYLNDVAGKFSDFLPEGQWHHYFALGLNPEQAADRHRTDSGLIKLAEITKPRITYGFLIEPLLLIIGLLLLAGGVAAWNLHFYPLLHPEGRTIPFVFAAFFASGWLVSRFNQRVENDRRRRLLREQRRIIDDLLMRVHGDG